MASGVALRMGPAAWLGRLGSARRDGLAGLSQACSLGRNFRILSNLIRQWELINWFEMPYLGAVESNF